MRALLLLLALSPAPAWTQDDPKLERDIRFANDPSRPAVMGQAIDKVLRRGAKAVPAILRFVEKNGHNALSIQFTDCLGDIADDRIAALCVELIRHKDFYWRPAATRSLARRAGKDHRDLLLGLVGDRLWGVRAAAILGLERIDDRASAAEIRKRLADDVYDVRAQAAKTLYAFGDESGIPVLVAALRCTTTWFEIDYGQIAREDAWTFLKKITGDDFGFKPWEGPRRRAPGLARWEEWMTKRDPDWREKVPETARPKEDDRSYTFGFELRSCQKGDFFFRVDTEGNLVLGYFNLVSVPLSKEDRAKLEEALEAVRKVDNSVPYGMGGCDFEQYYLLREDRGYDKLWIGIGGRPKELEKVARIFRELIEARFGAGESKDLEEKGRLFGAGE